MAELIKKSGSNIVTRWGSSTVEAPESQIFLRSTLTNVTQDLLVYDNATVGIDLLVQNNAKIEHKLEVSNTTTDNFVYFADDQESNVGNPYDIPYDPNDVYRGWGGVVTTATSIIQRKIGTVYVPGGVGIEKDLNVGGWIYGRVKEANTSNQVVVTATNEDSVFYPIFSPGVDNTGYLVYGDNTGEAGGLTYNPSSGKLTTDRLKIASNDVSTSTTTGAVVVEGGVGIGGNLTVDDIYTKVLRSLGNSKIQIAPDAGLTEVVGDIRVLGQNPIGTAPVVTNILYVTMDGDDTNDGRAMDASRACRTIGGALNSPYYQPGTQIRVAPGHYLEDNPLQLKPYTSIMGSDIRTTSIEPINKTQDLFHLNSGCYLAFMQFLNGRSGLLDGPYAPGYNRGAYCTAFPPLEGDERIDLFHSPYVQNCTNLSGPWLKDGTMFVPAQTVQIPLAVGTGTWAANTTTIVVNVSTGTITQGMAINAGQQNPGFYNARTLLLANKPFLQEQVVEYVDQTYPTFEYSREFCFRDVGIIVENLAYDAAFGGNEKAVESGLAYYQGVKSLIAGQETQTVDALNYLNSLVQQVIVNTTCTDLLLGAGEYSQVINTELVGGEISSDAFDNLFAIVTDIIINGPGVAPAVYKSTGPDAAFVSAEILLQANRKFIQEDTINWINNTYLDFPYSEIKCRRDTGLIVDSIAFDLLYPTVGMSQSTFAGLQYWNQDSGYTGLIGVEVNTTTNAVNYLKELAVKIIQNITPADDLIDRYYSGPILQDTSLESATSTEAAAISANFDIMVEIISGNNTGWTDRIVFGSEPSQIASVYNAIDLLQSNKSYIQAEVTAYITAENPGFVYDAATCERDVGYMLDCVCFDLMYSGNKQSIQAGQYYYDFNSSSSAIQNQEIQTTDAFTFMASVISDVVQNNLVTPLQTNVAQDITLPAATASEASALNNFITEINSIISGGPSVAAAKEPISLTMDTDPNVKKAFDILMANKEFIVEEVIAYIDSTYNPTSFNYNEAKCYRDVGLIVDAVSQDILLGGNYKSIDCGVAYWNLGYNAVTGQETTTTLAIAHARDIALDIIANVPVTAQTGTITTQVINTFFQYGGDYMPTQAVTRSFDTIIDIIENGPEVAPPRYMGGGLFALVGINGADVKLSPTVASVEEITPGQYLVGLSTSTVGFGINSTLYFGDTLVYPYQDAEVEALSLELTGSTSTWDQRKVDPIGSMGGSLVDGAVISDRSPIQSFVYDAFTQLTQGGRGIHITNNGYAQLVSVFTIFCSVGVQTDNGGIASIVNSNANFGDICLLSKGFGTRKFSGTIYNPRNKSYPMDPEFDQYYPNGYWPNGGRVQVFLPDLDDRPHISLIMEVVPPETVYDVDGTPQAQINEQGFSGFLNARPSKATLSTGTIVITDIDTEGIAIGNSLYIRDIDNNQGYVATGTVVTDLGYRSVTLNKALIGGGGDENNPDYFTLYFCGNAYYTVLSSEIANNPKTTGTNILSTAAGLPVDQVAPHIDSLNYLNGLVVDVINNNAITALQTATSQTILPLVTGGGDAQTFIDLRFTEMTDIVGAVDITAAEAVIPKRLRVKTGPAVQGASSAIKLIEDNIEFLADEVSAYVLSTYPSLTFDEVKCQRDVKIVLQRLIYDIESGGRYNSVMTGLSYWSRNGTHHLVQLGENVRRTDLFPDGSTVNFYQRSYISASGYVFEYVGAGTNYGALPQVGQADPVQGKETVQLGGGKVFFTSTDQNGDFRIGPGLVISQATGVLSGRTFTKSLFANMTPFILAIEGTAF